MPSLFKPSNHHSTLTPNPTRLHSFPSLTAQVLPPAFAVDQAAYLGGLVDLTGEIGRLSVAFGTARAIDDVDRCVVASTGLSFEFVFD